MAASARVGNVNPVNGLREPQPPKVGLKFMISTYFHHEPLSYLGPELRPHFILSKFGIEGSAVAAFIGPCDVKTDHLVDWEDRLANDFIKAKSMIHFLGEFFGASLIEGIWIQRLIVSEIQNRLSEQLKGQGITIDREGDDLFVRTQNNKQQRKMSVSIVTASAVSVLLHLGIDIDPQGAPNDAIGLDELKVNPEDLIHEVLDWFKTEYQSVYRARTKVRPVS
jgi:hypothetical protein